MKYFPIRLGNLTKSRGPERLGFGKDIDTVELL